MTYVPSETANEKLVFVDEYGNLMEAELQSVKNGTYNEGGKVFHGFKIGIMNTDTYVEGYSVKDEASYKEKDKTEQKMKQSSEKFYQDHPEELKAALGIVSEEAYKANPNNYKIELLVHYRHKQTEKFIQNCIENGKATHMMLIYNDQMNKLAQGKAAYYSWEQIIGKQPLDAPQEKMERSIENSKTAREMKQDSLENNKKVNLGITTHNLRKKNSPDNSQNTQDKQPVSGDYKGMSLSLPQKGRGGYE